MTVFIVCYALTSFVGGYVSGGYFARNDGKNWIKAMVATATVFPLTFFGIASILNTIAIVYHSLAAVSCLRMLMSHFSSWQCFGSFCSVGCCAWCLAAAQSNIMWWQPGLKLGAGRHRCFTAGYFSLLPSPASLPQGACCLWWALKLSAALSIGFAPLPDQFATDCGVFLCRCPLAASWFCCLSGCSSPCPCACLALSSAGTGQACPTTPAGLTLLQC